METTSQVATRNAHTALNEAFTPLIDQMIDLCECCADENNDSAIFLVIEQSQQLSQIIAEMSHFFRVGHSNDEFKEKFLQLRLNLFSILKAIHQSIKSTDMVAARDLISEDLRDNLATWKITVLPHIRQKA